MLPIEILKIIYEYDDTYVLAMNNIIKQIKKFNKQIEEYWNMNEMLYYMTEQEENYRLKLGLPIMVDDYPLPEKRCFKFWNNRCESNS